MKEHVKSIVLVILVLCSLFQTYLLTYGSGTFELNRQSEYVHTGLGGTQEKVEHLLFPERILLHFGDDSHTVLYPDTTYYRMIYQKIREGHFEGFRSISMGPEQWKELREKHPGAEIRFADNTPLAVLREIVSMDSSLPQTAEHVDRLWLYIDKEAQEVKALFAVSSGSAVFEATSADFNVEEVENWLSLAGYLPRYRVYEEGLYVPEQPLEMERYRVPYQTLTIEQLQKSLFLDPDITRNLKERNGSEIFTDGKRGLQVETRGLWMSFTDPIAPTEGTNNDVENLFSAVKFINLHEGWNGKYSARMDPQHSTAEGQAIWFRQYYDSYPIVDVSGTRFGLIKVVLQKGAVSGYERSLINLQEEVILNEQVKLSGGKELEDLLQAFPRKEMVKDLFPAFVPRIDKEAVELVPVWVLAMSNGDVEILK